MNLHHYAFVYIHVAVNETLRTLPEEAYAQGRELILYFTWPHEDIYLIGAFKFMSGLRTPDSYIMLVPMVLEVPGISVKLRKLASDNIRF